MPAFTRDLERTLQRALSIAGEKGHEEATLAHLALALTYDADAKEVLRACEVDLMALKVSLHHLVDTVADGSATRRASARPASSFNRAVDRATAQMRASGREQISGWHVLIGLLAESDDGATEVLRQAGVTRFDAVRYVSHGVRRWQNPADPLRRLPACDPDEAVRVLLLNDDFTPMEFVVEVLRDVFDKCDDDARRLMLHIHKHGFAECGVYLPEMATAKVAAVAKLARDHQHPLDCVMEPTRGLSDALLFKKPRTVVASGPGDRQRA